MHVFHVRYRNTQGTLMRILNAVSRRGIDLPYVQAEPAEHKHRVTLLLDVNPKQIGQLYRDWHAVVDVVDVLERDDGSYRRLGRSAASACFGEHGRFCARRDGLDHFSASSV